ncbi:hypothetical protein CRUP_033889, partial [Coryphaenoides rupestris]
NTFNFYAKHPEAELRLLNNVQYSYSSAVGGGSGRSFSSSGGRGSITAIRNSFNFYAKHPEAELRLLSGRFNGHGITSLGAHWGIADLETTAKPLYLG